MRASGHDDTVPAEVGTVFGEELFPVAGGVVLNQPFDEVQGPLLHSVRTRNVNQRTGVCSGGCLETDLSEGGSIVTRCGIDE